MTLPGQIAKSLTEVFFGGNWTAVNLEETLSGVSWQEATKKVDPLNTISLLLYHINYYVVAALKVLQDGILDAHDKYSFDCPPVLSKVEWDRLITKSFNDAENLVHLIENLPEATLWEDFSDKKYGNYFRNLNGIIEHTHYHLGQIVLIKKMLRQKAVK
ncbi:MAG: DUF1572 domain-containing protein [Ginsengibacter sp.]